MHDIQKYKTNPISAVSPYSLHHNIPISQTKFIRCLKWKTKLQNLIMQQYNNISVACMPFLVFQKK